MKNIKLSRDMTAIVDNDFYVEASKYTWYCNFITGIPYGARNEKVSPWKYNKVLLHRAALEFKYGQLPKGARVTFKNGDTLDCRSKNLVIAGITNKTEDAHAIANTRKVIAR
jgi:hypothetical protein